MDGISLAPTDTPNTPRGVYYPGGINASLRASVHSSRAGYFVNLKSFLVVGTQGCGLGRGRNGGLRSVGNNRMSGPESR